MPTTPGSSRMASSVRIVVGHPAGGLVEIEGDHRQLAAQPPVIADRILPLGKGEQRVGVAAPGLDGHGDVARAGHDHPVGHRLPPGLQHQRAAAPAERWGPRPVWAQTATPATGWAAIQRGVPALGSRRSRSEPRNGHRDGRDAGHRRTLDAAR